MRLRLKDFNELIKQGKTIEAAKKLDNKFMESLGFEPIAHDNLDATAWCLSEEGFSEEFLSRYKKKT
jgi:hypothetical protein